MKKSLIWVCAAAFFAVQSIAGVLIVDPRTIPVLIAHDKGMGSGCFLRSSNSVYLATAKHVLFTKSEGTNPPTLLSRSLLLKSYSRAGTTNVSERVIQIDLARLESAGEIRFSTNRDVALVRIQQCHLNNPDVASFLPGVAFVSKAGGLQLMHQDDQCLIKDVDVGAEVYMFGYPISLTGPLAKIFDPSEPLLRKGIVAGVNLHHRTVIIDCPSYFGNSGGPVLQVGHPSLGVTTYRLIGLVSGFVPFQEEWENKTMNYSHILKSNSGYTVIEPIDVILDLVWK